MKAVVLGASGGMGYSLVHELVKREIETIAFARSQEKLEKLFSELNVEIKTGDAYNVETLIEACRECDLIFHTISIPYPNWQFGHPTIMKNILQAAKTHQSKLIVIDNIYAYGKSTGQKVTEEQDKAPHTKKGKIRLEIEQLAKKAQQQGHTPTVFIHFPDFYGPNAENTILNFTLQAAATNKKAMFIGKQDIAREYIYTPDGAKAAVNIALAEDSYGQNWNIPGSGVISGAEIIHILRSDLGYTKNVKTITKWMIQLLGVFNKNMREVTEMMYLTEQPVILDGEKYTRYFGAVPMTPYKVGIRKTIEYIKGK